VLALTVEARPSTAVEWYIDGSVNGHYPGKMLAWLSWCADWSDELERAARAFHWGRTSIRFKARSL
jgi:hypothetical protein